MFKFRAGQHVWFLIGPLDDDEDPEYLEGVITNCYTDDDIPHGSPDAYYEIKVEGNKADRGTYVRAEEDLYGSLKELQEDVEGDLMSDVEFFEKEIISLKDDLSKTRKDCRAARRKLRKWQQKCNEGRKQLDQDMRDPNVFYFC